MKCESIILKEYKTKKKAKMAWPMYRPNGTWIPVPDESDNGYWEGKLSEKEVCGGDVTVTLAAIDEPDWGGTYAKLEVTAVCSRCQMPWYKGKELVESAVSRNELDLVPLLERL